MKKLQQPTRVFLALPCYGGMVSSDNFLSHLAMQLQDADPNLQLDVHVQKNESMISRGRSILASIFLDETDDDFLLTIDADVQFPRDAVSKLIADGKDVVMAACPTKGLPIRYSMQPLRPLQREGPLVELRYASGAFCLVSRRVFEAVRRNHPELAFHNAVRDASGDTRRWGQPMTAFYLPFIEPCEGRQLLLSEDWAFSARARAAGFRLWMDTSIELRHVGTHVYAGDERQLWSQIEELTS